MHRAMAIRTMRSPPRLIVTVGRSIARPAVATSASAVSCGEEWRRADLGTLLIMLLAQAAAERGVHTFGVSYLAGNRPVAALVEDAGGLSRQVIKQGIAEVSLALDHRPPTGDAQGIAVRGASVRRLAEEAPEAYKNVDEVVSAAAAAETCRKVARLIPADVVKG